MPVEQFIAVTLKEAQPLASRYHGYPIRGEIWAEKPTGSRHFVNDPPIVVGDLVVLHLQAINDLEGGGITGEEVLCRVFTLVGNHSDKADRKSLAGATNTKRRQDVRRSGHRHVGPIDR